jgi:outer membrane receptor protein involved in Fe transport
MDLEYLERVEVIRGPGSATLGQGALLGAINLITKQGSEVPTTLLLGGGQNGTWLGGAEGASHNDQVDLYGHLFLQTTKGQPLRSEGNATRAWEGAGGGLLADRGNRLNRANGLWAVITGAWQGGDFTFLRADQQRDMYNFRRDRNEYRQVLSSLSGQQGFKLSEGLQLGIRAGADLDDYLLYSHQGDSMGGTREIRLFAQALLRGQASGWNWVLGGDLRQARMGLQNAENRNSVINQAGPDLLDDPNNRHRWVFPDTQVTSGWFGEAFFHPGANFDVLLGGRWDRHDRWGSKVTPRVALFWAPQEAHRLRLSYQSGFRGAVGIHYAGGFQRDGLLREENFSRVAAATGGVIPNLAPVQPETQRNLELEWTWDLSAQTNLNLVAFRNQLDHAIGFGAFYTGDGSGVVIPSNVGTDIQGTWDGYWYFLNSPGKLVTHGIEASLVRRWRPWELRGSLSWVAEERREGPSAGGPDLTRASLGTHPRSFPESVGRLSLTFWPAYRWTVALHTVAWGPWYARDVKGTGSSLTKAVVGWHAASRLTLSFVVDNLLDQKALSPYTDEAPFGSDPRPGTPAQPRRSAWIKARLVF